MFQLAIRTTTTNYAMLLLIEANRLLRIYQNKPWVVASVNYSVIDDKAFNLMANSLVFCVVPIYSIFQTFLIRFVLQKYEIAKITANFLLIKNTSRGKNSWKSLKINVVKIRNRLGLWSFSNNTEWQNKSNRLLVNCFYLENKKLSVKWNKIIIQQTVQSSVF